MTCKICGKKLPEGSTVCKYCGAHIRSGSNGNGRYSRKGRARKRTINALVVLLALLLIGGVIAAIVLSTKKAGKQAADAAADASAVQEEQQPEQPEPLEPAEPDTTDEKTEEADKPEETAKPEETKPEETEKPEETAKPEETKPEETAKPVSPSGTYTTYINRTEITASLNHYRELRMGVNETLPAGVTITGTTWTSSDSSVVRAEDADGIGRAWGVSVGSATVTGAVTLSDGQTLTASCLVTVVEKQDPPKQENTATGGNGYILADSASRVYLTSELQGLTNEQLRYARNEIYARHGRTFRDAALQAYFNSQSWYSGTVSPENFDYNWLNSVERQNITNIQSVENSRG